MKGKRWSGGCHGHVRYEYSSLTERSTICKVTKMKCRELWRPVKSTLPYLTVAYLLVCTYRGGQQGPGLVYSTARLGRGGSMSGRE